MSFAIESLEWLKRNRVGWGDVQFWDMSLGVDPVVESAQYALATWWYRSDFKLPPFDPYG